MGDFYRASQGEEESATSFATCIEGLLSNVRDKYPQQIPQAKEQQLLKDRLFYGCQKGIRDSVKHRHADTTVAYMTFLEECRKPEDEDGVGNLNPRERLKLLLPLLLLLLLHLIMKPFQGNLENNSNNLIP